jgi:hypothetical protein
MSIAGEGPIRQESALLFLGGRKSETGTLLLFPDRLVHVASNAMRAGMLGGALGAVIAQQAAKRRAIGRAAEGGKGVIEIPFSHVASISKWKQGLNRNLLQIEGVDGTLWKLGVKFDKWAPDLARLVGPQVSISSESPPEA